MSSCYDGSFLCQKPQYPDFDDIAAKELLNPPSVHEIINQSKFCTFLPINKDDVLGDLTHLLFLRGLNKKTGLYHLWEDFENCTDHDTHTMRCIYVGKGFAKGRINGHIHEKFSGPQQGHLYASFYECENRLSSIWNNFSWTFMPLISMNMKTQAPKNSTQSGMKNGML